MKTEKDKFKLDLTKTNLYKIFCSKTLMLCLLQPPGKKKNFHIVISKRS